MKKTISFLMMASVLLCFASCAKSELDTETQGQEQGQGKEQEKEKKPGAIRTISGIFENDEEAKSDQTKTVLADNGKTPLWQAGDTIRILSDSYYENIILKNENLVRDGKTFMITTAKEHSGTLYAVYPASATTMTSMAGADGKITFNIPSKQKGTFASANICVAKGNDKDHFVFRNATAVLAFGQTASSYHVVTVTVKAANAIAGALTATFDDGYNVSINTSALTSRQIDATTVNDSGKPTARDSVYVAVAPVETIANANCYYQKENAYETASVKMGTKALKRNTIYNCPSMNRPVDPTDTTITVGSVKWAKNNLTIEGFRQVKENYWAPYKKVSTSMYKFVYLTCTGKNVIETDLKDNKDSLVLAGDYFQWAATSVIYSSYKLKYNEKDDYASGDVAGLSSGDFYFTEPYEKYSDGFVQGYEPYYEAPSYSKYNSVDHLNALEAEDDAATVILKETGYGDGWRLPTVEEFLYLKENSYSICDTRDRGLYVYKPTSSRPKGEAAYRDNMTDAERSQALFFLPTVGECTGDHPTNIWIPGGYGVYWTKDLAQNNISMARYIYIYGNAKTGITWTPMDASRYVGRLIRPVRD